jgi:hypothetical protein
LVGPEAAPDDWDELVVNGLTTIKALHRGERIDRNPAVVP